MSDWPCARTASPTVHPTWIRSVVAGGDLYVRPYNGPASRWYRAAMTQQSGRIRIAGTEYQVRFEPVTDGAGASVTVRPAGRCGRSGREGSLRTRGSRSGG